MSKFLTIIAFAVTLLGSLARAQDAANLGNRFARATITESDKPLLMGVIFKNTADDLVIQGAPLVQVIARAYGVDIFRVVDAPEWVHQDHLYDIEAVPPPAELVESDEALMLQSLLAERFHLQIRRETRETTMLVLDIEDPEKQRELALATPRYDPNNLPTAIEPGTPMHASTQAMIRGRDEPILDLTGGYVYLRYQIPTLPYKFTPLDALVERFHEAGVALEERTVPLDVIAVTSIERPRLDVIDR